MHDLSTMPAVLAIGLFISVPCHADSINPPDAGAAHPAAAALEQRLQMARVPFVANEGQMADSRVRYYATTFGGAVFVTDEGGGALVYSLPEKAGPNGCALRERPLHARAGRRHRHPARADGRRHGHHRGGRTAPL